MGGRAIIGSIGEAKVVAQGKEKGEKGGAGGGMPRSKFSVRENRLQKEGEARGRLGVRYGVGEVT